MWSFALSFISEITPPCFPALGLASSRSGWPWLVEQFDLCKKNQCCLFFSRKVFARPAKKQPLYSVSNEWALGVFKVCWLSLLAAAQWRFNYPPTPANSLKTGCLNPISELENSLVRFIPVKLLNRSLSLIKSWEPHAVLWVLYWLPLRLFNFSLTDVSLRDFNPLTMPTCNRLGFKSFLNDIMTPPNEWASF